MEMELFDGRGLEVPSMFIGGERDWGIHQTAGALNAMETSCSDYRGTVLVPVLVIGSSRKRRIKS